MTIKGICREFGIEGEYIGLEVITAGHINKTYLVSFNKDDKVFKYIVQRINKYVFKKPIEVMDNIIKICNHIKDNMIKNYPTYNYHNYSLEFLKAKDGAYYYIDNNEYYRIYKYIDNSIAYDITDSLDILYECGLAFGKFQEMLSDFDPSDLYVTIPNFHNTISRYKNFKRIVSIDKYNRKKDVNGIINDYLELEEEGCKLYNSYLERKIPRRVTHNDTKCNNVLIDINTHHHLAIIDLDTVMGGLMGDDLGDAIRFSCSSAKEDETDLRKVRLDLDKFDAFSKGYISVVKNIAKKEELDSLVDGVISLTIECGLRFLSDYLDNDKYFNISYPGHNFDRAKCQLKLAKDMISKKDKMQSIVNKYI